MKPNDLIGQVFNRLTVVEIARKDKRKNILWRCICECGGETVAYAYDLKTGKVKSCKCLSREGQNKTHGGSKTKEFNIWSSMRQRCKNPNDRNFKSYGGRGIKVCPEWDEFENFYADMGPKPPGKTLDRIDNNAGYSKENCEWRTVAEQCRNKRGNVWVTVNGERMILVDALKSLGTNIGAIHYYIKSRNLTHQEALDLWLARKKV